MEFKLILSAIVSAFQFPDAVVRLVGVLKKTPQEKHEDLLKRMEAESTKFEESGRPTWN